MTDHLTAAHLCARGDRLAEVARELREEMALVLEPPCPLSDAQRRAYLLGLRDAARGARMARAVLTTALRRLAQAGA
jgi:hypothetical protein